MYDSRVTDMIELFGKADDNVVICDDQQKIIWMNEFAKIGVLPLEEGALSWKFWDESEEQRAMRMRAIEKHTIYQSEILYYSMCFYMTAKGFFGDDGKVYSLFRFRLRPAVPEKYLRQVSSSQMTAIGSQYRDSVFHIYNALAPIISALEETGRERELVYAGLIEQGCHTAQKTTLNTDIYYRLSSGNGQFRPELIPLQSELRELINQINHLIRWKSRSVNLRVEGKDCMVRIDSQMLFLIVLNLLSNALRYSLADSNIDLELRRTEHDVILMMRDWGDGMSPEVLRHAFDPFYSFNPQTAMSAGLGLGLSVTKMAVEAQGGTILLTSKEGEGTTVTLRFPAAEVEKDDAKAVHSSHAFDIVQNKMSPLYVFLGDIDLLQSP